MSAADRSVAAWMALRSTAGLGPKRLVELALRSATRGPAGADLLGASTDQLLELGLSLVLAQRAAESLAAPEDYPDADGITILTPDHPEFPVEKLNPSVPLPVVMYAKGDAHLLRSRGIAISGSRSAAPLVLEYTAALTRSLVSSDLTIISGHAAGVDETAHATTLESGGRTIAVMAEGLGQGKSRRALMDQESGRFLYVSGFGMHDPWTVYRAMERNAWIAALAEAVVVVSAGLRGGSWAQGELCLKAGKRLFVPAFPEEIAPGNRRLIERGALPLDPQDPTSIQMYELAHVPEDEPQGRLFQ